MRTGCAGAIVRRILEDMGRLGWALAPDSGKLALSAACPTCGFADKHGVSNEYCEVDGEIRFHCPAHGMHSLALGKPDELRVWNLTRRFEILFGPWCMRLMDPLPTSE